MAGRGVHALLNVGPSRQVANIAVEQNEPEKAPTPKRNARANPAAERIQNGDEMIEPRGRSGVGQLNLSNQTDQDAVAVLLDQATGETLRMIYVSAEREARIEGIGPGVYRLTLNSGDEWNWRTRAFTRNRAGARSVGPFTFTQVQTAGQVRGDQYSIVLRGGNAPESEMSQAGM
jgi:hypothetical protein